MDTRFSPRRYFCMVLVILLAACATAQPMPNTKNTAVAMAQTIVAQTQMALPPTLTATPTFVVPTPSQFPTRPPFVPIMTPTALQVEHWREYQDALAKKFIFSDYVPFALCEWDILGSENQEVYVWAVCSTGGYEAIGLAVIHLAVNGTAQTAETPLEGHTWASDVQRMFPSDVQEKIGSYDKNHYIKQEMLNHIEWRRTHPDEPPLIILSTILATPTP